ncbi:hypothetical protein [Paenibacillus larvae]|uniref:Uncharacterized protein n=1 Tax=Paenibacillus phage Pagassa TaxID=2070195 RepID=A0A2I7SCU3_9CAUD|nr:hypothetical protein [Paenibacillus larvae]YP_009836448.1 hypothetical protein HWB45_gp39 [Paenibacillus phage Pagassa]AUS03724.1 hypothetical protein PAGASSA_39 [Paenibacillus phage Pagassa]AXF39594.1 hypothetical protein HONEYBEAR_35 [Paenibacillus phage Honeybear]MCY9700949.1 hypothetical protein [Paenibacillus larvae]
MKNFSTWHEERRAAIEMENQIMQDKLAQGVNGVEWLVMHAKITPTKMKSLGYWLEFVNEVEELDHESVMIDVLMMNPDTFYEKYELNWWIGIDEVITYLSILKLRDYDHYFRFLQKYEHSKEMKKEETK